MADRFQELLDAWVDGTLSDEQFAQLERRISEDASLRRRFLDYQSLRADLEEKAIQEGNIKKRRERRYKEREKEKERREVEGWRDAWEDGEKREREEKRRKRSLNVRIHEEDIYM